MTRTLAIFAALWPAALAAQDLPTIAEIGRCWNPGSLPPAARTADVNVSVQFDADGRPIPDSVAPTGYIAPDDPNAHFAFEAARRAVLRCGEDGYSLPPGYAGTGRPAEITFTIPEGMRP
ncbi:hypothetical protein HKCCE2091_10375 [Rhodobacterales bacterium HKCCE2091]|nr:hypothetical protein [Rhodobacterales bacterium HKCCE2091]